MKTVAAIALISYAVLLASPAQAQTTDDARASAEQATAAFERDSLQQAPRVERTDPADYRAAAHAATIRSEFQARLDAVRSFRPGTVERASAPATTDMAQAEARRSTERYNLAKQVNLQRTSAVTR